MDWSHLRVVLAIARRRSMTGAARILAMDQTTVGRRLTALERELKTALFLRSKAGFVPTEAGQIVVGAAEAMEARLDDMREALADPAAGATGVVRLMGNTWMLNRLAERALKPLMSANPRLDVRMSSRLPPAPLHSEPMVALWFDAAAQVTDVSRPIARVPYAAYSSKSLDRDDRAWVLFRDDDAQGPSFTRAVGKTLGADAVVRATATDAHILLGMAVAGIGHAVLPRCVGDETAGLTPRDGPAGRIDRVLHLHVSRDARHVRRVQVVVDWLEDAMPTVLGADLVRATRQRVEAG